MHAEVGHPNWNTERKIQKVALHNIWVRGAPNPSCQQDGSATMIPHGLDTVLAREKNMHAGMKGSANLSYSQRRSSNGTASYEALPCT